MARNRGTPGGDAEVWAGVASEAMRHREKVRLFRQVVGLLASETVQAELRQGRRLFGLMALTLTVGILLILGVGLVVAKVRPSTPPSDGPEVYRLAPLPARPVVPSARSRRVRHHSPSKILGY